MKFEEEQFVDLESMRRVCTCEGRRIISGRTGDYRYRTKICNEESHATKIKRFKEVPPSLA